jgi:hypothetical protein
MTFVTLMARFCDLQRGVVGEEAAIVSAILPSRDVGTVIIVRRATQSLWFHTPYTATNGIMPHDISSHKSHAGKVKLNAVTLVIGTR